MNFESRHLKTLQPTGREHCNTTNEEPTTQKTMTLQQCNWRTFEPKVKDMVARPLNTLRANGQGTCNNAVEELTV